MSGHKSMTLAEHIIMLRTNSGLSQRELGERINTHSVNICKWERGTAVPSPRKLRALSEYFNIDLLAIKEEQDELVEHILAEHIITLRTNSGLSVKALGEKVGASQRAVYSWESGEKTPSPQKLRALSEYFNIDLLAIKEEQDELVKKAAAKAPHRNPGRKKPASGAHGRTRSERQRDALATAQLAAALDDTGCRDLAAAVLALAVRDWIKAKKRLAKNPQNANARHTVLEVERFIRSPMYKVLYNTPPERMLNLMREALCQ